MSATVLSSSRWDKSTPRTTAPTVPETGSTMIIGRILTRGLGWADSDIHRSTLPAKGWKPYGPQSSTPRCPKQGAPGLDVTRQIFRG
jgi:hypothetical protein